VRSAFPTTDPILTAACVSLFFFAIRFLR